MTHIAQLSAALTPGSRVWIDGAEHEVIELQGYWLWARHVPSGETKRYDLDELRTWSQISLQPPPTPFPSPPGRVGRRLRRIRIRKPG